MQIEKLALNNFRNYDNLSLSFYNGINIIWGNNAQGKTNILEALYLFATARSHRATKDRELISFNCDFSKILINFVSQKRPQMGEITLYYDKKKQILINDIKISKISDLMGVLNIVFFSPEDLNLIKEGPSLRRKFLDIGIGQLRPNYYNLINQYNKILNHRNNLLKECVTKKSLLNTIDVWNYKLSEVGSKIMLHRLLYIDKIKNIASDIHKTITENKESFDISYAPSFECLEKSKAHIFNKFLKCLDEALDKDIKSGCTGIGPHRDDFNIFINGKEVKSFGSQGQQRTCVLTLKMAEMEFVFEDKGEYPVLLLDDIMSELDKERQKYLLKFIYNKQVILTCTDFDNMLFDGEVNYFYVENGKVTNS